jgi:hypothetical protein
MHSISGRIITASVEPFFFLIVKQRKKKNPLRKVQPDNNAAFAIEAAEGFASG